MWDLRNRAVITLVSVLSGCVFLYNVWGPILILTISLFLTIYACYSLTTNDSLLSPHAFILFDYCKCISLEVRASLENIVDHIYRYIYTFWETARRRFRERYLTHTRMDRRRGMHYQLSTDSYSTKRNSSGFDSIAQLSPIPRTSQKFNANDIRSENKLYHSSEHSSYDRSPFGKHSSSSLFQRSKEEFGNESIELMSPNKIASKRIFPTYIQSHTLPRNENIPYFMTESTWDTNVSPKVHSKVTEAKAMQTVAGPLLTSNRCNIDPKVYNDVTSPGLTARLTKYAAEANNKLTHQSQYRVGQFPKVNLQASPVPLITAKTVKTRTPVTVRVAPPNGVQYSPPGKQKILSNLYQAENEYDSPLVTLDPREISLKRHASREDVTPDLPKKQRTGSIVNKEFEIQDETKQKRTRDESSKSEEDISPQNKTARPTKRTKTPSCYDILNSLSSSKNVISGVKRKARDFSRSGTPDFEKHFKSLECVQSSKEITKVPEIQDANVKYWNHDTVEKKTSDVHSSPDKIQEHTPVKGILKTNNKSPENCARDKCVESKFINAYNEQDRSKEIVASTESAKLTNKLFMRAEPKRNEKLRMLVEEQGNIRAKFTTDDVEEIKREDIADMRQTSMKARLQSMFDAISGKASRINPDVVIQAEEVNAVKSVSCPVTCATLNSLTTTTNVNTTPISTSAVAPSPTTNETGVKTPKHVTFSLPNKEVSLNTSVSTANDSGVKTEKLLTSKPESTLNTSAPTFTTSPKIAPVLLPVSTTTNVNLNAKDINVGKSTLVAATTSIVSSGTFTFGAVSSNNKASASTTPSLTTTSTPTSLFGNVTNTISKSSPMPVISSVSNAKIETSRNESTNATETIKNVPSSSSLGTFGGGNATFTLTHTTTTTPITTGTMASKQQSTETTSTASSTSIATPFKSIASGNLIASSTVTPASTSLFTFGNKNTNTQPPKSETFVFGSGGNATQSTSAFESLKHPQETSTIKNVPATTSSVSSQNSTTNVVTSNAFSSNTKTTAITFGSSNTGPSFTFGATTSTASSNNKPIFSFGNAPSTTNVLTGTSSSANMFGTGNNNPSLTFATSTANTTPQFTSSSSSIFGNVSTSTSIFKTTSSQPVFGTPSTLSVTNTQSTTFTTPTPKSTAMQHFGSNVGSTSTGMTSTSSLPVFSNTTGSSSGIASTTSTPIFGSITNTSASGVTGTSGNLFSNTNSTTLASSFGTTRNIFGQAKSPGGSFKSVAGVFGTNTAPLFGTQATSTPAYNTTNISSNTTVPTFGSTNVTTNTTVPTFGATNTAVSAFGSQNNAPFGNRTSMFGTDNTSTSVFGASTAASPFNPPVSSSTFGGQNTTTPTFGAAAGNVSAFADNKSSPFGSQTSAFGTPNPSAPTFGAAPAIANNGNNNASNIFTFGANQKPPQQNSTFSFGSNNNTNNIAAPNSTPFQFGATTSKSVTGFNFTAPTTAPSINFGTTSTPIFNAPTPGMFNIGSGSTAPRSRNVRTRKPR